ncbi:MAG: DNA-deoxyinosine glycosylase [Rhodospirillales bacterium]|nr:DNA-deoxyinosine glycosylase [Rhodospirillales bacterium]
MAADRDRGFPPIAAPDARLLILGTLPGQASLAARQYYAHPRNAFWPILGAVFGFAPEEPYEARVAALLRAKVAVWDVCEAAVRPGSLDSAIRGDTIRPNDFAAFFKRHPAIARVGFNGATAAALYRRHAQPTDGHDFATLPSTSPAHAAMGPAEKRRRWASFLKD